MDEILDRRARKTRRAIQNALVELLKNNDLNKLKIKDVTDAADVNRTTFYLHYCDLYDVLNDLEDRLSEEVLTTEVPFDLQTLTMDIYPLLKALCEIIESEEVYKKYLTGKSAHFLNKIKNAFKLKIIYRLKDETGEEDITFLSYAITYASSGAIDAFEDWFNSERPVPLEVLSKGISALISKGLSALL